MSLSGRGSRSCFSKDPSSSGLFLFFLLFPFLAYSQGKYPPSLPSSFHEGRREALRDSMNGFSMAAFFSAPVRPRSNDIDHEYVQDKNFYYLSGCRERNSLLLIFSDTVEFGDIRTDELIFLPPSDPKDAIWHEKALGPEGAEDSLGIGQALPNTAFDQFELKADRFDRIHWMKDKEGVIDNSSQKGDLASLLQSFDQKTSKFSDRRAYEDLHSWTSSMREIKDEVELEHLEKAIDATVEAHKALMRAMEPGMWEYQAEALVEHVFRSNGCSGPGFPSIVGSGGNSCVLHYSRNGDRMEKGEMVVIDIGGEYGGYSADITRTLPTDGNYSKEERFIYELVLQAQRAGIAACRTGQRFWDPHRAAQRIISKGLLRKGIIDSRSQVKKYFMHGTSHYLGLDVHDVGSHGDLRPGNVLTVEPGIYIPEGSGCDEKWWNIGVRIEDDILVTKDGPLNLSGAIPRSPDKVEKLMKESIELPTFVPDTKNEDP